MYEVKLKVGRKYRHENIIRLLGYCEEEENILIVYEHALSGSLDMHLNNPQLTWGKRLKICIGIATGLDILHEGRSVTGEAVILSNIRCSTILLDADMNAKISLWHTDFITFTFFKLADNNNVIFLSPVSLFTLIDDERLARPSSANNHQYLIPLAKNYYEKNELDELVFESIKEQHIMAESLSTFANIAYKCLHDDPHMRPTASDVQEQLRKELELQVDWENWEAKLPSDYKEIFQQSRTPEICDTEKKERLYNMFSEGIFIQKDKVVR
ncbi:receptor-like protein kinase ANXUR1 [Bidens hawaiensis]|uniref:receptor-like protein kinase ANXUR1 n=1 Tax=Bidens hawaiensis TaxID=980011 RepID=UPI00404B1152